MNALPTNENLSIRKQSLVYVRWEDRASASWAEIVFFFVQSMCLGAAAFVKFWIVQAISLPGSNIFDTPTPMCSLMG